MEYFEFLRQLNVIEEDIKDQIRKLEGLRSAENLSTGQLRIAQSEGRINEGRDGRIISIDLSEKDQKALDQYKADLESISNEITTIEDKIARTERLKQYPTVLASEWERLKLETGAYNEELDDLLQKLNTEIEGLDNDSPSLPTGYDPTNSARVKELGNIINERLQFDKKIDQLQLAAARSTGNELVAIEVDYQQQVDAIKNNELITAQQRHEALLLLEQTHKNKLRTLNEKEAQDQIQLDREVAQLRYNLQAQSQQALYSLQQGFAEENKTIAIAMLAVEKGLAIAQVLKSGALASGEAQLLAAKYAAASITPLGPNPVAIAAAANAQAQVANIGRITALTVAAIGAEAVGQGASILTSGEGTSSVSSGGNVGRVGYRGFDSTSPNFSNPSPSGLNNINSSNSVSAKEAREIRITDGFGNMRMLTPKEQIKNKLNALEEQGNKLLAEEKYELFAELKEIYEKYKQEYDRL